ncbi:MAG: ATP-dependent ligase [Myxococcaceae bacterium]|nr:ATP-dependent ligase [Myxococcaceae bacterium]
MTLPFKHPLEPMLAKLADAIPTGDSWIYEPKWDGFRALIFKDGDDLYIQSRDLKPLNRYFPELEGPLRAALPDRCVLDGEIVIATGGVLDFDALLLRIHPAASRVAMLAKEAPSSFVAWDLLALGDEDLRARPQAERRKLLETALGDSKAPVHLTPITSDPAVAQDWFQRFEGAGLDGVIAKPKDLAYLPGKRAMMKIKHARTADCVVAGFRWYKDAPGELVGSMLLGLYDGEGVLHSVGVASSFKREERAKLTKFFEPYRKDARESHPWKEWAQWSSEEQRMPGATSRWNRGKDLSWEPLRIELVAEVAYDHMQGDRFRHATHFKRWRHDKPTGDCRYDQLEVSAPAELRAIFGTEVRERTVSAESEPKTKAAPRAKAMAAKRAARAPGAPGAPEKKPE